MTTLGRLAVGLLAAFVLPLASQATDYVPGPVASETVTSLSGDYAFDIALAKRWRSDPATGTLRAISGAQSRIVWKRSLPQPVRPRYALVTDDGAVVLFDQFDNIKGPIAILLINRQGEDVATMTFEDISRTLGKSGAEIVRQAKHGAWIQTPPVISGTEAHVGVAGKTLAIDTKRGRLHLVTP